MNGHELQIWYGRQGRQEKLRFLVHLVQSLTIVARSTYFRDEISNAGMLIKVNEIQHRLSRFALDTIDGIDVRADADIVEYILAGLTELGALKVLDEALQKGK